MIFKISGFIILMGLVSFFQTRQIMKKEGVKEAVTYIFLMCLAVLIGSLLIAGVDIPSQVAVSKLFAPIGKAVLGE